MIYTYNLTMFSNTLKSQTYRCYKSFAEVLFNRLTTRM